MVLVNTSVIGRDRSYWDALERFESNDVDFRGTDFKFISFNSGRQMCPGIGFGLANMDLMLASLLYHFDWELPGRSELGELDMAEALGMAKPPARRTPWRRRRVCVPDEMTRGVVGFGGGFEKCD